MIKLFKKGNQLIFTMVQSEVKNIFNVSNYKSYKIENDLIKEINLD